MWDNVERIAAYGPAVLSFLSSQGEGETYDAFPLLLSPFCKVHRDCVTRLYFLFNKYFFINKCLLINKTKTKNFLEVSLIIRTLIKLVLSRLSFNFTFCSDED